MLCRHALTCVQRPRFKPARARMLKPAPKEGPATTLPGPVGQDALCHMESLMKIRKGDRPRVLECGTMKFGRAHGGRPAVSTGVKSLSALWGSAPPPCSRRCRSSRRTGGGRRLGVWGSHHTTHWPISSPSQSCNMHDEDDAKQPGERMWASRTLMSRVCHGSCDTCPQVQPPLSSALGAREERESGCAETQG